MSCSEMQEETTAGERQADLLVREIVIYRKTIKELREENVRLNAENSAMKGARKLLRLKIRSQAEEMQKLEEQLQEEVNFSNSMSEVLKQTGE